MRLPLRHVRRPSSPRRRGGIAISLMTSVPLVAATVMASAVAGPAAPQASALRSTAPAAAALPATSSTHPYSMPIWLPVHDETYVDCVLSNPGCGTTHTHWTMDVVLETLHHTVPRNPGVFAMGAGILHVQVAHGRACRNGGTVDFGTTAWIDHGGGVVSRYGHLARILYPAGTRLAAGQAFAVMGTTGKNENCSVPYLDFQVRTHGVDGPTQAMPTLRVCSSSASTSAATWPTDLDATRHVRPAPLYASSVRRTYTSFNYVPKRTVDLPATTSACVPTAVPATPSIPTGVRLAPAGRGRLSVSWTRAPATPRATSVQVQLSEYHPSTHTWDYVQNEEYRTLAPTATRYTFTGLVTGHTYRSTVVFRNGAGYSRSVHTAAVTSVGPPSTPGARGAYVTRTSKSAGLHFGWTRPKEYGLRVHTFQVQVRRLYTHTASAWTTTSLPRATTSVYRPGVRKHARYQVRVRATYHGGVTAFLTRTLRT